MPPLVHTHELPEDERIRLIGEHAMKTPGTVGVVTDDDDGKLDRYLTKLFTLYPKLKLVNRFKGPTPGVVTAIVQREE